jgi:hypothetical protein
VLLVAFLAACATDGAGPGGRPGPATLLVFSAQPNAVTAGAAITPAIQVTARDARGNTATGFAGTVTVALGTNPGGATLTGVTAVAAVAGVATFTDLILNKTGSGYTLVATSGTLTAATSAVVTVSAAAATELAVTGQPGNTAAGAALTPAVQVTVRDAFGNTATGFTGSVTVAIGTNPSGGVLTGTTTRPAVAGVATFPDLSIDKSGAGYTLAATANALIPDTSATFTISAGSVSQSQSTVSASPTSITASNGSSTSTITVVAKDAFGNLIQGATVVLAASGTGNTLTQPAGPTTVSGVATGAVSSTAAEAKTISATIGGVAITQTAGVTVTPAPASRLDFTAQPSATGAGIVIAPPIQAEVRDQFGNRVTTAANSVNVSILNNAGSPAGTLSGTRPRTAVGGVVTFNDLSIDKAGTGYTLLTSSTGLTSDTSSAFNITAGGVSASQSIISAAPAAIAASSGASTSTITVTARDGFGNPVQGATVVLFATGTGNTLTQPVGTTSAMGVATGTLSSTAAEAKIVSAVISGVVINQTDTVTVTSGVAVSLAFTAQPSNTAAGAAITPTVQLTARDQFGNTATGFTGNVVVAIGANPGGGTLSGDASNNAVSGIATFNDLSINKAGTAYTLTASSGVLPLVSSVAFNITAGTVSAARSLVSAAPGTITASTGSSVTTITVTGRDAFDNPIQGAAVVLSSTGTNNSFTQPGPTGSSGVTTGTLSSTKAESKTVSATIGGVLVTQTAVVTVNPAGLSASQSTVSASPTSIEASNGAVASTITVTARDALGNPIPGAAVILGASGSGNTVTQPAGTTTINGVATGSLTSTTIGAKVISATIDATPIPGTDTVTVVHGEISASRSTLQAAPASIPASNGSSISTITVIARDDQGNPVSGASVALSATGSGNTLTQPAGATDVNGVATGTLRSTVVGAKVVSGAIDGTGIEQTDTVTVTPSVADRLAFIVQPGSATVDNTITPAVQVEIRDQFGNRVTGAGNPITLAIGTNPGGGTLTGGGPVAAVNGVATFTNLSIDQVGSGYTLTAAATSLSGATSTSFNISAGVVSASQSGVDVSPASIVAGSATSTITVTARDAGGNPVSGATVVLSAAGGGTTITQPAGPTNGSGIVTGTLSSTAIGMKTVSAIANGVAITQQRTVTVTAGPVSASQSTLGASPASIVAGSSTSTITVTAKDAFGNRVTGATVMLFATGSGNTLTQPSGPTNGSGVATGTLSSTNAGTKVVSATAAGVSVTQTATVTVTAPGSSVVMVGAGDIATCNKSDDEATAALVNAIPGEVFALGDNVYEDGTTAEFNNCYNPSWGAFKSRTHPAAGNHEYNTSGALPYYAYFGAAAGSVGQGYYSYDVGAWHVIVLNSNISTSAGSAQVQWLEADLAAHQNLCTMAYWHHPLYSSIGGTSGTTGATISSLRPLWDALYAAGADLVLTGHRHVYERLAPMRPDGTPDNASGIRSFVVGTGGNSGGDLTNIFPTSEEREGRTYGVMKLTLHAGSYDWQFIPVAGETYTDNGTGTCH